MGILRSLAENLPRLPDKSERSNVPLGQVLRSITAMQYFTFFVYWLAWTCDAIDFFAVSLGASRLSKVFHKPLKTITTAITLTLLFRPLGAIIFGLLGDRFGRKWPLIGCMLCCGTLSLGTAFTKNFGEFLAVRSLFGIAMGGVWGICAAGGLEMLPAEARGLFSGILQQGYAVGYLLSAVINLTLVAKHDDWRILFFFGAAASAFAAGLRFCLPESAYFLERRAAEKASGTAVSSAEKSKIFIREAGRVLKLHWPRCVFALCLMSGFNFFSHGSQDVYPSLIKESKGLSAHSATLATIIGNCGAIAGGTIAGWGSQYLGRRLTIIACCLWSIAFIPLWYLPNSFGPLAAGAFCMQFGVQGAWGVIPVYLSEISPPAFRAVFPGLFYQLGNMVSSASAQIETTAGANLKTAEGRPDYGKTGAILIGTVAGWIILCCLVGRESHGAHFENAKAAFEQGAASEDVEELDDNAVARNRYDAEKGFDNKAEEAHREQASLSDADMKASTRTSSHY
ncbi:monocarboxylate/H+ symporter [Sporobolomyces koalae]|uniref:monocarboxylate/H+ symporter n=1 Tax=Sporobolomyces koalae TaxID=500713 RepID=UPI00317EC9B3